MKPQVLLYTLSFILVLFSGSCTHSKNEHCKSLLSKLSSGDDKVRIAALEELDRMGPNFFTERFGVSSFEKSFEPTDKTLLENRIVPKLCELLKDSNHKIRVCSASALGSLNLRPKLAIKNLVRILESDKNWRVRRVAAISLGKFKSKASSAIPALVHSLKDENPFVRESSARAIGRIKFQDIKKLKNLIKRFSREEKIQVRKELSYAIMNASGIYAISLSNNLVKLLRDSSSFKVRENLAQAIGKIGKRGIKQLLINLDDFHKRSFSKEALEIIGEKALPSLIIHLKEKQYSSLSSKRTLISILGNIGRKTKSKAGVELLLKLLKSKRPEIRAEAIRSLRFLSSNRANIISQLRPFLNDKVVKVRRNTTIALGELGVSFPKKSANSLTYALKDKSPQIRYLATYYLGKIKEKSPYIIKCLKSLVDDNNGEVRAAAITALSEIDPCNHKSIFLMNLETNNLSIDRSAAKAVSKVRLKESELKSLSKTCLSHKDSVVRAYLTVALGNSENKQTLTTLIKIIKHDKDKNVQIAAIDSLMKIGILSPKIKTCLKSAIKNRNYFVSRKAQKALRYLQKIN